ncbi:MAG: hypothetical protein R6X33_12785, partial [Candidatus Brocadiia bacterium]
MTTPLERIDFEAVKQRFDAYWRRELPGRPLVAITAPRSDSRPPDFEAPESLEERWTNIEYQCNLARHRTDNTLYLGEAFPMFLPNIGPDSFAAYLGANLRFVDENTSWVEPFVEDLSDYEPTFDRSNRWWRHMCDLIDAVCEVAEGRFLVGIPDMHGGGDALAAIRPGYRCNRGNVPSPPRCVCGTLPPAAAPGCGGCSEHPPSPRGSCRRGPRGRGSATARSPRRHNPVPAGPRCSGRERSSPVWFPA